MFPLELKTEEPSACGWVRQRLGRHGRICCSYLSSSVLSDPAVQTQNQVLNYSLTLHPAPFFFFFFFPTGMAALSIADSLAQGQCAEWQNIIWATARVKSLKGKMSPVAQHLDKGKNFTRSKPQANVSPPVYGSHKACGLLLAAAVTWHLEGQPSSCTSAPGFMQHVTVMPHLDSRRIKNHLKLLGGDCMTPMSCI